MSKALAKACREELTRMSAELAMMRDAMTPDELRRVAGFMAVAERLVSGLEEADFEALLNGLRQVVELLPRTAHPVKLADCLDRSYLERAFDQVNVLLQKVASPEAEFRLYMASSHLGQLLACVAPRNYGQPASICPISRDLTIRLFHEVGHDQEAVAAYVNAAVRFALNVGLTAEELQAETRSERIRTRGTNENIESSDND